MRDMSTGQYQPSRQPSSRVADEDWVRHSRDTSETDRSSSESSVTSRQTLWSQSVMRMGDVHNNNTQSIADYLAQLLKDKKQLAAFPNVFIHMERLLDEGERWLLIVSHINKCFINPRNRLGLWKGTSKGLFWKTWAYSFCFLIVTSPSSVSIFCRRLGPRCGQRANACRRVVFDCYHDIISTSESLVSADAGVMCHREGVYCSVLSMSYQNKEWSKISSGLIVGLTITFMFVVWTDVWWKYLVA